MELSNMDYTNITLGKLLSSKNTIVKRCAVSILKILQQQNNVSTVKHPKR